MRKRRGSEAGEEEKAEVPEPPKVPFKRVAGTLGALAILVALLNVAVNVFGAYSMGSLELEISPHGDLAGFHQDHDSSDPAAGDPWAKAFGEGGAAAEQMPRLVGQRGPAYVPGLSASLRKERKAKVFDEKDQVQQPCPGLCAPPHLNLSQAQFISGLLRHLMKPFPAASFRLQDKVEAKNRQAVPPFKGNLSSVWARAAAGLSERSLTVKGPLWRELVAAVNGAPVRVSRGSRRGTQLKVELELESGQRCLWKPQRYKLHETVPGDTPYSGPDRHNAEIVAFHLADLLRIPRVPVAIGKRLTFKDLEQVADPALASTFFTNETIGRRCFYGTCGGCSPDVSVCAEEDGGLAGALVLWLPDGLSPTVRFRSPWARTYVEAKTAAWERDELFCQRVLARRELARAPLLLDLMEMAVLDWLTGNADRHRLEMGPVNRTLLLLDNGKGLGDPAEAADEPSILAPLYQCCRLRRRLYDVLMREAEGNFGEALDVRLRQDPLYPLLSEAHYAALNRRLRKLLLLIAACVERHGEEKVLVADGF